MGISAYFRLLNAGFVLAREGALGIVDIDAMPPALKGVIRLGRMVERRELRETGRVERLTRALNRLGPTYVKFGQTLATRPDIVGATVAADLSQLQDRMATFDPGLVPGILNGALGDRAADLTEISPPIAAASIAQVHRAVLSDAHGRHRVAVKLLRPGVAERFHADIESQYAGARLLESLVPRLRRLRPVDIVKTLDRSARLELNLRLEAAAISEMSENIKDDRGFRIPRVYWDHGATNVLTTSWVDGIPVRDLAALDAAGVDRKELARNLLQSFLRHAMRDGYFHADLHPGNLFADPATSEIIAVDFGIMGRLGKRERRFLAEILYGFITRDYRRIAERHFEIGYVPAHQSVDEFTLALRAIGEPLHGRAASDIEMSRVLGQLFATTELFEMKTRPELILLQKSMVLVEGVSRMLDPALDIWTVSEPVVGDWVRRSAGPIGRLEELGEHLERGSVAIGRLPALIDKAESALDTWRAGTSVGERRFDRFAKVAGFWMLVVAFIALLWRLLSA
jgi:ubiquinone biosynthesis protein